MITYLKYLLIVFFCIGFTSCEDVINVDLETSNPKLVIDASIKWQKGTTGNEQTIYLTTTGNYYSNSVPAVSGANVSITDQNGTVFNFIELPNTGKYVCSNFVPVINRTYTLFVSYNGNSFTATDKLYAVPTITSIQQRNDAGFTGNQIELKYNFLDNLNEANFYLEHYEVPFRPYPLYGVFNDEFTNGNPMFSLIFGQEIATGQTIKFTLHGISQRYFNYMNILIGISGGLSNGPFSTPPATVRGNIVNTTNPDAYALGYFRLSEVDVRNYIVQ